jgi:D-arabinose 1-dehydrogenase-like Zn-dependent alcohol dehydrogenase
MSMKVVEVDRPGGDLKLVERPVPDPGPDAVRIKIEACGVCRSDVATKDGLFPGIVYPRVPGHEIVGRIDSVGANVVAWKLGERVGVGWHGGNCGHCNECRDGDFTNCENREVCGITYDGGYAEYMIARQSALVRVPDELEGAAAAPLLCAGLTSYNAMRNAGARAGDVVAILGIGGVGHLAVQFSSKMGFKTIAVSRGRDKKLLVGGLGADAYIDADVDDIAAELQAMGGARVIFATAPDAKLISSAVSGLTPRGKLFIVAAAHDPLTIFTPTILSGRSIHGWSAGNTRDSEDMLAFTLQSGVRPRIEKFPLERAAEAYAHMLTGRAQFRAVIVPD